MSQFIANSFQVPNAFIDEMLFDISGNACKIYLLIVRKTRGWHKEADKISYSQIQKYTGINSRTTISKALDELLDLGLIIMQNGNEKSSNEYRLNDGFASPKNGLDKNCTSPKNEPASPKNGLEPSPKNGHTEIHIFKNTNQKYNEYDTHTHETQTDENHQNAKKPKTTSSVKKSKSLNDKLTADDLMNLKLSDFKFSDDDFNDIPNLGNWLFNDLDYQVVKDYIATRKTKLTITAVKMIVKQSALANINLNSALEFCIDAGWQSFKADWYFNRQQPKQTHFNQQPTNRMDELRHMANTNPTNVFVDDLPPNFDALGVNYE